MKIFNKIISVLLTIILLVNIMCVSIFAVSIDANDVGSNFSETFTDELSFMSDSMAEAFIGFIYNVNTDKVTDEMKSADDIFNYLTGRIPKGTDEYIYAQYSFLITSSCFINKQISVSSSIVEKSTENLIELLQKKAGSESAVAQEFIDDALGRVKSSIKKILYYALELDDAAYASMEMALSMYQTFSSIPSKVESLVDAVKTTVNSFFYLTSANNVGAYNYYVTYLNNRYLGTDSGILEVIMSAYNIGNTSYFDGIVIALDKLGFGNSWTSDDIQKLLRIFAEFTYHSYQENYKLALGGGSGSSGGNSGSSNVVDVIVGEHTMFFNYSVTFTITNTTVTKYKSSDTSIMTVDSKTGCATPIAPGVVWIYLYSDTVLAGKVKCTVLPFKADMENNQYSIYQYLGNDNSISLPSLVENIAVTGISDNAFRDTNLTNITIPNSVTSIGDNAFRGCSSLTNITIPDSVTSIGDCAFYDCISLTSITIPNSITRIGEGSFYNCQKLNNITLSSKLKEIAPYTFAYCNNLASITIPDSVTSIGDYVFYDCISLTSVTILNSITYIGTGSFYNCQKLNNITLPIKLKEIAPYTFAYCNNLASITIPDSVTSIGDSAFAWCSSLTNVTIPNSITRIGEGSFYNCEKLNNITLPIKLEEIAPYTFTYCKNLTSITIPKSVTSIGEYAFAGCGELGGSVEVPKSVKSIGKCAFADTKPTKIVLPFIGNERGGETATVENSLYYIFSWDLDNNQDYTRIPTSLKEVEITDETVISPHAFDYCDNVTKIKINEGITSIGDSAFAWCSKLTNITIPDSVTSIGDSAFAWCSSLTNVTIPDSVTSTRN